MGIRGNCVRILGDRSPLRGMGGGSHPLARGDIPAEHIRLGWGGHQSSFAAAPGTTILGIAGLPIATTIRARTATTTSVFECVVCRRALFAIRAGGWEFTGSI